MPKKERNYGFWNWGTGIAITMILGASAIIFLVYKSHQVEFSMVEKDYYSAEIKYDQKKSAQANTRALSERVDIHYDGSFLIIKFPKECIGQEIEGDLILYRPSGQNLDIEVPFVLDNDGIIIIQDDKLVQGKYILKGDWTMNDKEYNVEQSFFVEK